MADIQTWRVNLQHVNLWPAHTPHEHTPTKDLARSDIASLSTSPEAERSKNRLGPKRNFASFASYISAHRTDFPTNTLEMYPVDWSNVNGKDEVYRPDSEKMYGTLLDQLLRNPFEGVPSNYNTFILHVLEAHRQLQVDKNNLQSELEAERECHSSDVDEFHRIIKSLSEGGWLYGLNILHTEPADSLRQQGVHAHTDQQDYVNYPTSSSQSSVMLSTVDTKESEPLEDVCCKRKDSTPRALKHHRLLAPSRQMSTLNSLTTATELGGDLMSPIPLPSRLFLNNNEPAGMEIVLSPMEEYRASESSSDTSSSGEDFNTDTVLRLTRWLALRVGCQEKDVFPEIQELLRYRSAEESGGARSNLRQAAPNMPTNFASAVSSKQSGAQGAQPSDISSNQCSLLLDSGRRHGHRRGFSFLPGDDSTDPVPSELPPNEERGSRFRINMAARKKGGDQIQLDESHQFSRDGSVRRLAFSTGQQQEPSGPLDLPVEQNLARKPQCNDSGKSVLTAVRCRSSRGPSLSHRDSIDSNIETDGAHERQNRFVNINFAIAAARAAKSAGSNVKSLHRPDRS